MAISFNYISNVETAKLNQQIKQEIKKLFKDNLQNAIGNRRQNEGHQIVSFYTQELRCLNILESLETIVHMGGFSISSIHSLKEKHIDFLVTNWMEKGLMIGTIANKITYMKTLALWLGKQNIVKDMSLYQQLKDMPSRTGVAEVDKSWKGAGICATELIAKIAKYDKYVGIQLAMQLAYGLRRQESMMLIPSTAFQFFGGQKILCIDRGTKGNRDRNIRRVIDDDADLRILDLANKLSNKVTGSTIPAEYSLKQWKNHYIYVMQLFKVTKSGFGITSHGLRHEAFHNLYELLTGEESAVRGGEKPDSEIHLAAQKEVSHAAGHKRPGISNAYLGNHANVLKQKRNKITDEQIIQAIKDCNGNRSHAAELVNMPRSSFYVRLNKMGVAKIE